MDTFVQLINEVGFPIAAAGGLGLFIWKLINRIIDGMETKLDTLDDKQAELIANMEERVRSLDNEIIRQDTLIKTILGVPNLIDSNKIAKADRDDQRKD